MGNISEKTILEFQRIAKEEYGRDISFAEASEIANGLVGYFDLLAKIKWRMDNNEGTAEAKTE